MSTNVSTSVLTFRLTQNRHVRQIFWIAIVAAVTVILPAQTHAQAAPPLQSASWWQTVVHGLSQHLGELIVAGFAVGVAYLELSRIRKNADKKLELDERRFGAEQIERDKRMELQERQFKAEESERNKLVRFREQEYQRFSRPSADIAEHVARNLCDDPSWAAHALEKAKFLPYTNTLFGERSEHFQAEKQELAKQFTPYLLRRCETLAANGRHVFLMIDAGTTLFPFFETIGMEAVKRSFRGDEWLKRLHLTTNNLPGIGQLIKSGKRVPWDRYSKLAIEDCRLLPGVPMPVFAAVAGDETDEAIQNLRSRFAGKNPNGEITFIALVVGNWIRIGKTEPPCPIPLARGDEHKRVKQRLVDNADEVFVICPLGKIFVDHSNEEVNDVLGFTTPSSDPERERYQDVHISDEKAARVKLVSTMRAEGRLLHEHSKHVEYFLRSSVLIAAGGIEEPFGARPIEDLPHLLFPFGHLPSAKYEEFMVEFPHEQTRTNEEFLEMFKVDRQSI